MIKGVQPVVRNSTLTTLDTKLLMRLTQFVYIALPLFISTSYFRTVAAQAPSVPVPPTNLRVSEAGTPPSRVIVQPTESADFLQIPGVGFQTFHHFLRNDPTIAAAGITSGSAYFRWMWSELEPQEGSYNFALIDNALQSARAGGQTLEFRVMLESPPDIEQGLPPWLVHKGVKLRQTSCEGSHSSPDLNDPILRQYHNKLIQALGQRYDGHPDLGSIDIGSVGLWGEWHEYCAPGLMPSVATRRAIIDLYYAAFPRTPVVQLVDDVDSMSYAAQKGRTAWRGDCWGDLSYHVDQYDSAAQLLPNAWKNGMVALESCGSMSGWVAGDLPAVVSKTLGYHATYVHNKSNPIPTGFLTEVKRLVIKLGFRLVLRKADFPGSVTPGAVERVILNWSNVGIAPPYRDFRIGFRLRNVEGTLGSVTETASSIKGMLPGDSTMTVSYPVPTGSNTGNYTLELGLIYHGATDHTVPLAIQRKTQDGWYPLGAIVVK